MACSGAEQGRSQGGCPRTSLEAKRKEEEEKRKRKKKKKKRNEPPR